MRSLRKEAVREDGGTPGSKRHAMKRLRSTTKADAPR
jgi:hypothetical protein